MLTGICRYLTRFKKIIRDQRVFEDNQVDPSALETCLASVAPVEDASVTAEEEGEEVCVVVLAMLHRSCNPWVLRVVVRYPFGAKCPIK